MPQIEVMLEVPLRIAAGLASGQLERVGGVIRESGSKQVVAWLREGGKIASNTNFSSGLINNLLDASTGGLASAVTGAVHTAVTAHSHFLIMQQMARLETLIAISAGIGVVNIAVSTVSMVVLLKRLNELEKKINGLYEHITQEHRREKLAKLRAAISAAQNAFDMEQARNKEKQAHNAIDRFDEVRDYIINDLESFFKDSATLHDRVNGLVQAIQIDSMLIRCHLELDELSSAQKHLNEYTEKYESQVHELVGICLGGSRQAYFLDTDDIDKHDLYRFVAIEDWLHRSDKKWNTNSVDSPLMKVLEKYRGSLTDSKEPQGPRQLGLLNRVPMLGRKNRIELRRRDRLLLAELLIEKFDGLRGFQAELKAIERLGTSYSQWQEQQNEALAKAEINLAERDDYALLVDEEWLAEQSDSSAA